MLGLELNLPRIEARRQLRRACEGEINLTADGWFDLTFAATGDRDAAEEAHNAAVRRAYKAGRVAE